MIYEFEEIISFIVTSSYFLEEPVWSDHIHLNLDNIIFGGSDPLPHLIVQILWNLFVCLELLLTAILINCWYLLQ